MPDWRRKIVVFLASQTLSLFGSSLVQYAIIWHITLATGSGAVMTAATVAGFLPSFLLSPFAGVWADRFDRKKIIVVSDAAIALVTLSLAMVFMAGHDAIWLLLLASGVRSAGSALHGPAVGALLPQIVPPDSLMRVNGVNGTIQSVVALAAPLASGALLGLAPIQYLFFIDTATAAVAIGILVLFLHVPTHERATKPPETGWLEDLRLGFRYIRGHRSLVSLFAFTGVLLFLMTPAAFLTPLQVTRSFGPDVWRLTAVEIAFSVGMLAGGVAISAWGGFRNRARTMVAANLAMAACAVALGLVPTFWLYIGVMTLFGVVVPFFNTPASVILQERVEPQYLGRVFSVLTMLMTSLMPLGMLVFGPLADVVRIEWTLLATGGLMLLVGVRSLTSRGLMEAGLPASPPAAAQAPALTG